MRDAILMVAFLYPHSISKSSPLWNLTKELHICKGALETAQVMLCRHYSGIVLWRTFDPTRTERQHFVFLEPQEEETNTAGCVFNHLLRRGSAQRSVQIFSLVRKFTDGFETGWDQEADTTTELIKPTSTTPERNLQWMWQVWQEGVRSLHQAPW